jgi:hypothetical protein
MPEYCYNFHNFVNFKLITEDPACSEFILAEYHNHAGQPINPQLPEVILRFTRRDFMLSAPAGYTWHTHKGLARWGYRMQIENQRIEIDAVGNRFAIPMIYHMMVHPSLRYLVSLKGILILHAAAIARQGKSLILTGKGGTGKSTTCSIALAVGGLEWSEHADDYVFLGPGPTSYAYLTRTHIYRYMLKSVPELGAYLTGRERVGLELFGRLRSLSGGGIRWPVRVEPERMWPGRARELSASPAGLFMLRRSNGGQPGFALFEDNPNLVDDLLKMNFGEARHYVMLVKKCAVLADYDTWLAGWQACERALIEQRLAEIAVYDLSLPTNKADWDSFAPALINQFNKLIQI